MIRLTRLPFVLPNYFFGGGGGGGGGFIFGGGGELEPLLTPLSTCGGRGGGGFEPFLPICFLPSFFHKFNEFYFFNIDHY